MERTRLRLKLDTMEAFIAEFESNLCHGGTFVSGVFDLNERDEVELVVAHPEREDELKYQASVVWVVRDGDGAGVGLAILGFGPAQRNEIKDFIKGKESPERAVSQPPQKDGQSMHERLRGLTGPEQQKIAREGEIHERIQLERLYGKMVWETILRNPRVTVPEVARIAKMGSLPRHLFELIGSNTAFLKVPQVRRAILGNPKTPQDLVDKVLRLTPRAELRLVPSQLAYPRSVRDRARRLLMNE